MGTDATMTAVTVGTGAGDEDAFRDLFAATYDDVRRFVRRRAHPADVPDVLSEVYLVAWRRLADVPRPADEARAWLYATARNLLANRARGDRRQTAVAVRIAAQPAVDASRHDDGVAARVDLGRAFAQLSAADQEVLALAAWDGLSQAEAGAVLGISAGTYGVRLARARRRLAAHLGRARPGGAGRPGRAAGNPGGDAGDGPAGEPVDDTTSGGGAR